jgi:hypothetical protein
MSALRKLLAAAVVGSALFACAETPPRVEVIAVPRIPRQFELRSDNGEAYHPLRVREAFDKTAQSVCQKQFPGSIYHVVQITHEPEVLDPALDLQESPINNMMARRHYDVYDSNMDGIIECRPQ